jgi:hypothetical protein
MAKSKDELQEVIFRCDASHVSVSKAVYLAGNMKELADWTPNVLQMYDDGTHGDSHTGDGIWSLALKLPVGVEVQYKYTNSGARGEWSPGDEFPSRNRPLLIKVQSSPPLILNDIFGR